MKLIGLVLGLSLLLTAQTPPKPQPKKAAPAAAITLKGCVDESDAGHFILRGTTELDRIVRLHGDGFDDEGFAKHMGNVVRVTGKIIADTDGARAIKVKTIVTVAEGCG